MTAIGQLSVFFILVTLFHFGYPHKYTDHDIDEFSKRIKDLIYPKDQRGRYPYDYRQHTPEIYFDDYSKPYNDEYLLKDKLEKPPSKGFIGSSEGANLPKNNDKYSKTDDEKYDNSDKADINSEEYIKNKGKELHDKKDEDNANKEGVGKDDIKKVSNEGFDKNDEVTTDNGKDGYKSDEKTVISENEHEISNKENEFSPEIEISPSPLSLTDNDNSKIIPSDKIDNAFSTDFTHNENNNNNVLPIKIEENIQALQNIPESLQTNLLDNKATNIASGNELSSSNQVSDGLNSIVSNANSDPTNALSNIQSVPAFENQNNGVLYNNGFSNDNYSPYNSAPPYLYDILGFSIPNVNAPSNFAPNNFFNNYSPSNSEFYRLPNFNQQQYQPVQLNNGQIVLIPYYWPIHPPFNSYSQNFGSGQVFQPNNQIYPRQNIPSIQNFNGNPGSINRDSVVPGIQNVPRWLWYSNQYIPFENGQDNIEGKTDNKPKFPLNLEGVNPKTNAPLSISRDGIKDSEIKEDKN